ncbi:MAG TPA: RimK family protein [Candidatus Krumholzibacteria bacterium]
MSTRLFVVDNPSSWPLHIPGVEVVSARDYLAEGEYSDIENAKVFNLCRSYRYMSSGYYVSLLAVARGHRAIPSIMTLQDMRSEAIFRIRSEELDELIQRAFSHLKAEKYQLNIYFGKTTVKRYERLATKLFSYFEAPLLRAEFVYAKKQWELEQINPIGLKEIPDWQRPFVVNAAGEYFLKSERPRRRGKKFKYDLAILVNPEENDPPSDPPALRKFSRAAEQIGLDPQLITREDYRRIAEFDALFIRETTAVNHHTYRFSRRAAAEGLAVIDDPESIIRCTNKVYLAEMFDQYKLPTPKTMIVHRGNAKEIVDTLSLPCVLKQPDSSFSRGVVKLNTRAELDDEVARRLDSSDLLVAQEFMPTDFDWRIGVLEGKALYTCRYFMAHRHWQILKRTRSGDLRSGRVETIAVPRAPRELVRLAVAAASAVGNGLYGVDMKQRGDEFYLIEVNDNPSIEAGCEDKIIGDKLYLRIMKSLLRRIEEIKGV